MTTTTTISIHEKLVEWTERQLADYDTTRTKLSQTLSTDLFVTDYLFDQLLEAQSYVQVAHYVKLYLEEDAYSENLRRYVTGMILNYSTRNGSPIRTLSESYTHEAWLKVAKIGGMI